MAAIQGQANIPPEEQGEQTSTRSGSPAEALVEKLHGEFLDRIKEYNAPASFPDRSWDDVEKARRDVVAALKHVK